MIDHHGQEATVADGVGETAEECGQIDNVFNDQADVSSIEGTGPDPTEVRQTAGHHRTLPLRQTQEF
jgi:hypothetical protein